MSILNHDTEAVTCTQTDHDEADWIGDARCDRCGKPRQLPQVASAEQKALAAGHDYTKLSDDMRHKVTAGYQALEAYRRQTYGFNVAVEFSASAAAECLADICHAIAVKTQLDHHDTRALLRDIADAASTLVADDHYTMIATCTPSNHHQVAAVACTCGSVNNEHTHECAFRPMCLDKSCHNFRSAMIIDDAGYYDCPDLSSHQGADRA